MRGVVRNTLIYSLALFLTSLFLSGLKIEGGFLSFISGGFVLYILFMILKPVLSIISLPLNLVTLGIFSSLTNAIILYVLTVFYPKVRVEAFTFEGYSFLGFIIPSLWLNTFFAFIAVAVGISLVITLISWLIEK